MALSSPWLIYAHNVLNPTCFTVVFTLILCFSAFFPSPAVLWLLLALLVSALFTFLFEYLSNKNHPVPSRSAVLITGCSSGIGADTAVRLVECGFLVFAGVRHLSHIQPLHRRCQAHCATRLIPIQLDVTDEQQLTQAYNTIQSTLQQQDHYLLGVVNNAGYGEYGPLELLSLSALNKQFAVNVLGQFSVTRAMLPLLRLSSTHYHGIHTPRIVFVSSGAGRVTIASNGAYCASKHALNSIADTYRVELKAWGIDVVIIEPGEQQSAFNRTSARCYNQLLAENTQKALSKAERDMAAHSVDNPSSSSSASAVSSVPVPLPLSIINHYDRCYTASLKRRRVVGSVQISTDAIECALLAPKPLIRYSAGDDAAVLSLLLLLPQRFIDWYFGSYYYKLSLTPFDDEQQSQAANSTALGSATNSYLNTAGLSSSSSRPSEGDVRAAMQAIQIPRRDAATLSAERRNAEAEEVAVMIDHDQERS